MKTLIRLLLIGIPTLVAVEAVLAQGGAKPAAGIKAVANVKQIMLALTIPSSTELFSAAAEPPKTDEGWAALQNQVLVMTESANLLMTGTRVRDQGDWMIMSRALVDAGEKALKIAVGKNGDALAEVSDEVYTTCEACHKKYMEAVQPK